MTRLTPRPGRLALALAVALAAPTAALAQTDPPAAEGEPLGDAARRALEGLLEDLEPVFDALRATIEDLPRYGPPEILPNGDILIPRLDRVDPADPTDPAPEDPDDADRLDL